LGIPSSKEQIIAVSIKLVVNVTIFQKLYYVLFQGKTNLMWSIAIHAHVCRANGRLCLHPVSTTHPMCVVFNTVSAVCSLFQNVSPTLHHYTLLENYTMQCHTKDEFSTP